MMKISIDGPKGSGKSTICESLRQKYDMRHEYISYKHVYTPEQYGSIINVYDDRPVNLQRDLIMERGILSSWVYTWSRDGVMKCEDWYKPNTLRDFTSVIEQFDVYAILYSSDHEVLRSRISNRQASTGKGFHLGEIEAFDLTMSNRMFECWGRIFSEDLGLNNVLLLDIARPRDAQEYHELILDHGRSLGADTVPFDPLG